jgi:catechol 2,3-dioxygenase-like lactoylglutathione lyase family enzyme
MTETLKNLNLVSLFVEDLAAGRAFYGDVLGLELAMADEHSAMYKLGDTMINLLTIPSAEVQIAPAKVGSAGSGSRVQFAIVVEDVDALCAELESHGVAIINGPADQPWGMRTACFADPAGHNWEFAQPIS